MEGTIGHLDGLAFDAFPTLVDVVVDCVLFFFLQQQANPLNEK